jgi:hypothetical protein
LIEWLDHSEGEFLGHTPKKMCAFPCFLFKKMCVNFHVRFKKMCCFATHTVTTCTHVHHRRQVKKIENKRKEPDMRQAYSAFTQFSRDKKNLPNSVLGAQWRALSNESKAEWAKVNVEWVKVDDNEPQDAKRRPSEPTRPPPAPYIEPGDLGPGLIARRVAVWWWDSEGPCGMLMGILHVILMFHVSGDGGKWWEASVTAASRRQGGLTVVYEPGGSTNSGDFVKLFDNESPEFVCLYPQADNPKRAMRPRRK